MNVNATIETVRFSRVVIDVPIVDEIGDYTEVILNLPSGRAKTIKIPAYLMELEMTAPMNRKYK